MIVCFGFQTLLAFSLFSAEMYGYSDWMNACIRVMINSNGGWILENRQELYIEENLSWLDQSDNIQRVMFFIILAIGQMVTLTVVSVYVSKIRDDLLKARQYEK